MYQVYFLSVLTNIVAGIALAFERMDDRLRLHAVFNPELFRHTGFQLAMGVITFVVGFAKLLSVTDGNVPVVGDLLPALSGMVMGFILVFQYYQERTNIRSTAVDSVDRVFGRNSGTFGMIGIIVGVVHLLVPGFLFL